MEQQLQRYALGAAGAGFVLVWTTLGLMTAIVAAVGACAAMQVDRLPAVAERLRSRRARPARRRDLRARTLRDEAVDALPLIPDEPSLIIAVDQ